MAPILETLNEGVVVISDDSNEILFVNAVFEEMTGILRGEIVGHIGLSQRTGELAIAPGDSGDRRRQCALRARVASDRN